MSTAVGLGKSKSGGVVRSPAALLFAGAIAVFVKDVRCELRARHALGAVLLFAVTSTVAVSFALRNHGGSGIVSSALLWLVIYFSAMSGLARSFAREDEARTSATLKLAAPPNSVYIGKLAFNWAMLTALEVVAVPLFFVLMSCPAPEWGPLVAILLLGGLGLAAGATMAAAMVARAAVRGALYTVVCFPLLFPVLAAAIHGSGIAMTAGASGATGDVKLIASYCGTVIIAGLMLFRYLWED